MQNVLFWLECIVVAVATTATVAKVNLYTAVLPIVVVTAAEVVVAAAVAVGAISFSRSSSCCYRFNERSRKGILQHLTDKYRGLKAHVNTVVHRKTGY